MKRILVISFLAFALEVLALILLILIIVGLNPQTDAQATKLAESIGYYFGPISGFTFCLGTSYFIHDWFSENGPPASSSVASDEEAADSSSKPLLSNGLILGVAYAAIDISILLLSGAGFQWVFVFSNLGRVGAGFLGSRLRETRAQQA